MSYITINKPIQILIVGDSEVPPSLLTPLRRRISEVSGDGAYDTKECHKILKKKDKTTYPTTKKC